MGDFGDPEPHAGLSALADPTLLPALAQRCLEDGKLTTIPVVSAPQGLFQVWGWIRLGLLSWVCPGPAEGKEVRLQRHWSRRWPDDLGVGTRDKGQGHSRQRTAYARLLLKIMK